MNFVGRGGIDKPETHSSRQTIMTTIVAPKICGAKLRDGTACQLPLSKGKARCFNHGGAPRSGAPKGNSNSLKDGTYADGGVRKPPRRAGDEMTMRQIAQWALFNRVAPTVVSPAEQKCGQALAESLRSLELTLRRTLRRRTRLHRTIYSAALAQHDVLERVLAEPSCFASEWAYRCRVAAVSLARFEARSKLRAVQNVDALGYSEAWARFCAELFWTDWPKSDDGLKP